MVDIVVVGVGNSYTAAVEPASSCIVEVAVVYTGVVVCLVSVDNVEQL